MAGWSWATVEDMNQLLNHYVGFEALGPGPDFDGTDNFIASTAFYGDGWQTTGDFVGPYTMGTVSGDSTVTAFMSKLTYNPFGGSSGDRFGTDGLLASVAGANPSSIGAWFYVSEVPVPAAVWLFGSAILGLGVLKRKKV